MTDPGERLLRRALDEIASDAADPAAGLGDVRERAHAVRRRRRRTATAASSLAVLATAATLSASALAGVLPAPAGSSPPAVLPPAGSVPAAAPSGSAVSSPSGPLPTAPPVRPPVPSSPAGAALPLVPATPAAAVLDTIGVTVHLDGDSGGDVVGRLRAAGIRHVRTDALPLYSDRARCDDPFLRRRRALTDAGIRLTLTVGLSANLAELRATIQCLGGPRSIAAIEGQNEPDRYVQGDWVRQTRAGQQALYRAVKGDPMLAGIPVLAPTPSTSDALGSVAQYADLANVHPFQASYGQLEPALRRARTVAPGKPMVVTDLGWSNATAQPAGRSVAVAAPEEEVATELPRILLDNARRGILRTYIYSLADDRYDSARTDLEAGFGLLRHDGTPKPAYAALSALTATLTGDSGGQPAPPGGLAYRLSGRVDGLDQILLRRSDGVFVLALWGPDEGRAVDLVLARPARTQVIDPGRAARRGPSGPTDHLEIRAGSGVVLIEIGI